MGIPRTGSQGLTRDMWALCQAACYEPDPVVGHDVFPPDAVIDRFDNIDRGESAAAVYYEQSLRVPFDPKCKRCRQVGKRVMERRGLTREQVKRCFDGLGAKWEWTSRESDEKRRNDDSGVMVVTDSGVLTTDRKVAAKKRREARRIERDDQKALKG